MGFGKFGAKPRGMSNPIYWVSRHMQDQKRQIASSVRSQKAAEREQKAELARTNLRERLNRLLDIYGMSLKQLYKPLDGKSVSKKDHDRLKQYFETVTTIVNELSESQEIKNSDLSRFAIAIKNFATFSVRVGNLVAAYSTNVDLRYDAPTKTLLLDGVPKYFLG